MIGPLLPVFFINDLPKCIRSAIPFIFVDNTKCLHVIRSTEDTRKLQTDINIAFNWSTTSDLLFNESIFIHLCFYPTTTTDHPTYTINGNPIKISLQHKDLGVTFSSNFNWSAHYNIISTKAYQTLYRTHQTNL